MRHVLATAALCTAALGAAAFPGRAQSTAPAARADYLAACRNTVHLVQLGAQPLALYLQRIAALTSVHQLAGPVGQLQRFAIAALFGPGGAPLRAAIPPRSQPLRLGLLRLFTLLGDPPPAAAAEARAAILAEVSLTSIAPSGPARRLERPALDRLVPSFDWRVYFKAAGGGQLLPAASPAFLRALNGRLLALPLATWKSYLRATWLTAAATLLSPPFVTAGFAMHGQPVPPRARLCRTAAARFPLQAYIQVPIRRDDYFGDTLRLRAWRARQH